MPSPLVIAGAGLLLFLLSLPVLLAAWRAFRSGRWFGGGITALFGLLLLTLAALAATITVATRGYRALTAEQLAATVRTEPQPAQRFHATIVLPGQPLAMYELAGDAFYIDAHILKWHPVVNLLGLQTAYELDRVAGRYTRVADERSKPHTVYSVSRPKPLDMFHLVKAFPPLALLVDAEYGSATFTPAGRPAMFDVLVSTTGLLIRPATP
jgi:hypothetical protein